MDTLNLSLDKHEYEHVDNASSCLAPGIEKLFADDGVRVQTGISFSPFIPDDESDI